MAVLHSWQEYLIKLLTLEGPVIVLHNNIVTEYLLTLAKSKVLTISFALMV